MDPKPRASAFRGYFFIALLVIGRYNTAAAFLKRETGSSRSGPLSSCKGRNVATHSTAQPTAVVSDKDAICKRVKCNSFDSRSTWAWIDRRVPRKGWASLAGDWNKAIFGNMGIEKAAVVLLRGGSAGVVLPEYEEQEQGKAGNARGGRTLKVQLSTTKMSSYVDARGEVMAQSDWTVGKLKEEVEKNFPGKIPASLQRLFKGTRLLPSEMTLEEASEGAEGPLCLLLDNAPPIDASRFDPETAVPSRRDGQVEAFSACLAAQAALQESLLRFMRGVSDQDDPELTRSVRMKADFENTQALLRRTLEERPDTSVEPQQAFGIFHEALRPLAHSLDVNWLQSAQYALFAYICAQFGARGAVRQALTFMLIPLIFLSQTRPARVGLKLARNLAAEIPVLTQLFMGILQAPGQVIMSLDSAAYTKDLYGSEGPRYDEGFLELEEELDMEWVTDDNESYD